MGEKDRTVLCRWSDQDAHLNYGEGPAATEDEFIKAVEKMLQQDDS